MKEKCLTDDAYELVKNIDSLKDIWEQLALRYGDNIQIVDAVNHRYPWKGVTRSMKMEKEISNLFDLSR